MRGLWVQTRWTSRTAGRVRRSLLACGLAAASWGCGAVPLAAQVGATPGGVAAPRLTQPLPRPSALPSATPSASVERPAQGPARPASLPAANATSSPEAPSGTGGGLALTDAEHRALERSPQLAQARAREQQALARVRQVSALANPTLVMAGAAGQNTGGLDEGLVLSDSFALGDKRTGPMLAARAELAAAQALTLKIRADVVLAVASAYYDALRADAEVALAVTSQDVAEAFVQAAGAQLKAGDVPRSHLLRAEIERDRAVQAAAAARADRAARYAVLASLVGLAPKDLAHVAADPQGALEHGVRSQPALESLAALQARALQAAPELRAAQLACQARAASVRTAQAQANPDLFVEGRSEYLNPLARSGGTSVRLGVSWPLLDLGSLAAGTALARAELAEQAAGVAEVTRQVALEVETSWYACQQARAAVDRFGGGRLERSRQLLDMMRVGYTMGASTYLEVLDAARTWSAEQADYLRALATYHQALAALRHAVGGNLP
jgi:outer membrane protein, heavy metal efflux system